MKSKPFINTLEPRNKVNKANKVSISDMDILVRTATVFSKPEFLPPKSMSAVGTIRRTNSMIFHKLNPSTEKWKAVK